MPDVSPDRLAAAMRRAELTVPAELNDVLATVLRERVLPESKTRAPHRSGRLAGSLSVVQGTPVKGPAIRSPLVYANVQHYGGRTLYAQSRVGRSGVPKGRAIRGTHFVSSVVEQDRDVIANALAKGIGDLLEKSL